LSFLRSSKEGGRIQDSQHREEAALALARLKEVASADGNIFAEPMRTVRCACLGEITRALYQVGGQYWRNM
jgi:methylmalonyl-CoA mutase